MRLVPKVVLCTLVVLLASVSAARAADMCFTDVVGGFEADLFVGKGFTLPTAGNCKEFNGYFGNTAELLWGNACATSDNATVRFNLQYSKFRTASSTPFVFQALAQMQRSTGVGQVEYIFESGPGAYFGGTSGVFGFKKIPCPPAGSRPLL